MKQVDHLCVNNDIMLNLILVRDNPDIHGPAIRLSNGYIYVIHNINNILLVCTCTKL